MRKFFAILAILLIVMAACASPFVREAEPTMSRAQFRAFLAGVSPAVPNVAESGAPTIYDYDGNVKDIQWLWDEFGDVTWVRADPHPDAPWVFRLMELRAKCGPAALIVKVLDENGSPLENYEVIRYWPTAPELPDFSGTTAKQWTTRGVHGPTNAAGDIGFGMGGGDYYFPDEGQTGVSWVYVADFDGPGDLLKGLGMIGLTDHCHIDSMFQRLAKEVGPTPTPPPGPTSTPGPGPSGGWDIDLTIEGSISPKD